MTTTNNLRWLNGTDSRFAVRGLGWYAESASFRRLPPRAEGVVSAGAWGNSRCSSGVRICFRSNTAEMHVRVRLDHASGMAHMPATGQSGVVVYEGEPYRLRPWGQVFPDVDADEFEGRLFGGISKRMREYTLYLPLYNGVRNLAIGLSKGARVHQPSPCALDEPVVFYGTSITMGGCAHTPDADFPSIIGRRLNLDTINLGFSGAGKGEPEVAEMLAEIDASMLVLDYSANVAPRRLKRTLPKFIALLRDRHPTTPIVLMSRTLGYAAHYSSESWEVFEAQRDEVIYCYSRQRRMGDMNLHFIDCNSLLPPCTELVHSDGLHPTQSWFSDDGGWSGAAD